ncbi:MAG: nickel-dependent lactate racemase [Phascolarctobacterium sp.]|nr:nickel-dependent lactate racemase [Phascolarctobacterium sp.]
MKKYSYKCGHGYRDFTLDETRVLAELVTKEMPPVENLKVAVLDALYHPIGEKPINELVGKGKKVAFIGNDLTSVANSFEFMPILVNEMNKLGVRDEDMHIVFSLGTHRIMTEDEMAETVGREVAGHLKMYNSDCNAQADFIYFGDTSYWAPVWIHRYICDADLVILTGSIVHHYFAGFCGGRKVILHGCAAMETVRKNHSLMMLPEVEIGKLHGNRIYEDQMEWVSIFAKEHKLFLFNAVLDAKKQFLKIFAGDWEKAHLKACGFVDEVYGVTIDGPADIVIASCGGYPNDINVYQLQKTMDNAWCAVREGGAVIIIGECEEGSDSAALEKTMRDNPSPESIKAALGKRFVIGANKAFAIMRFMKRAKFILVSGMEKEMSELMFFEHAASMEEAMKRRGTLQAAMRR